MGAHQVKCSCTQLATTEIRVKFNNGVNAFRSGFSCIKEASGYGSWYAQKDTFIAHTCDTCADQIGDQLDLATDLDYEMTKSDNGYWRHDLP